MILGFMLILIILIAIIVSSLPLYFAVFLLGGDASILKVFLANLGAGILAAFLVNFLGYSGLIALIFMIFIYSVVFNLGFIKAFLAWLLQYVIAAILVFLAIFFFGAGFNMI